MSDLPFVHISYDLPELAVFLQFYEANDSGHLMILTDYECPDSEKSAEFKLQMQLC